MRQKRGNRFIGAQEAMNWVIEGIPQADGSRKGLTYGSLNETQLDNLMIGRGAPAMAYLLNIMGAQKTVLAVEWIERFFTSQNSPEVYEIPSKYLIFLLHPDRIKSLEAAQEFDLRGGTHRYTL